METIGMAIRSMRESRGWSLDRLAARSGLKRDAIWKIEDGRVRKPQGETYEKLAKAFGMDLIDLLRIPPNDVGSGAAMRFGESRAVTRALKEVVAAMRAAKACNADVEAAVMAVVDEWMPPELSTSTPTDLSEVVIAPGRVMPPSEIRREMRAARQVAPSKTSETELKPKPRKG